MKKMLFLFQAEKLTKVLVLSVTFFFVGLASVNAQYMNVEEASITLKSEIETLENDFANTTSNDLREDIAFKHIYISAVLSDINNGTEVGAAIQANTPTNKPQVHSSGLIAFTNSMPDFKIEVQNVVAYMENLLSE